MSTIQINVLICDIYLMNKQTYKYYHVFLQCDIEDQHGCKMSNYNILEDNLHACFLFSFRPTKNKYKIH